MAIAKWIQFGQQQQSPVNPAERVKQPPVQVSSADVKQFGLENFGNTCYANSVLQALYFCSPFRDLVVQYPEHAAPECPVSPPPPSPPIHPAAAPQPSRRKSERKQSTSDARPEPFHQPHSHQNGNAVPSQQHQHQQHHQRPPSSSSPLMTPPTLFSALRSLFLHISKNPADRGTVAPRAFIDKLKEMNELFRGTMHQDAHEFLNFLLNKIVEEMEDDRRNAVGNGNGVAGVNGGLVDDLSNSIGTLSSVPPPSHSTSTNSHSNTGTPPQDATIVHRLFEGILTSETRCLTCETVSSRDESFLDLSIDIEQNSSVTACLRQFSASEMLCQRNKFFCDSCCGLQEAEKRMKIKKLPNILALHLKRFKYQEDVQKYIKLAYRVAFPFELRLFNTVDDAEDRDRLYELFAIVVHIGNGPHHGHYITIVKSRRSWFIFDDETVETIKESDIPRYFGESNAGSAYVLYYQAVDMDVEALGLKVDKPLLGVEDDLVPVIPPGLGLGACRVEGEVESEMNGGSCGGGVNIRVTTTDEPPTPISPNHSNPSPSSEVHPSPISPTNPNPNPAPQHHESKGGSGFLHTLRHSQSAKIKLSKLAGDGEKDKDKDSNGHKGRSVNGLAAARPSTSTGSGDMPRLPTPTSPSVPPLPLPPISTYPAPPPPNGIVKNGKGKEPERKASTWFKRKSLKNSDDERGGGLASLRPANSSATNGGGGGLSPASLNAASSPTSPGVLSSTGNWFKTAGPQTMNKHRPTQHHHHNDPTTITGERARKLASEPGHYVEAGFDSAASPPPPPPPTSSIPIPVPANANASTSSLESDDYHHPLTPLAPPISIHPSQSSTATGESSSISMSLPNSPSIMNDKTISRWNSLAKKRPLSSHHPTAKAPPRPSTAGAPPNISSPSPTPDLPVPPIPPLSSSHPTGNHEFGARGMRRSRTTHNGVDPLASVGSISGSGTISTTASTATHTTSSSGVSNNTNPPPSSTWKRASRKLSLTGTMLSFGRKKDKDRDPLSPPVAFQPPLETPLSPG